MAEGDDSERTESPTQKRLDDARKRGQVPRSRDLSAAAVTLAGGIGLSGVGSLLGGGLANLMRSSLSFRGAEAMDDGQMLVNLGHAAAQAALAISPILGILLAAALLAPLAIGGWNFSAQAMAPDFSRLDPVAGIGRVFSLQGLFELLKSLARFGVVAGVAVIVLRHQFHTYAQLGTEPVRAGILHAISMAGSALIALGGGLAAIAAVDVPLALWQYHRGLRMSREEIRQEARESEGSPEVRQRVRQVQQEMARKRMMSDVPKADVVITNPTHYAVALRYDEKRMRAPVVVAKGADLVAARIREIAAESGVPLVEAPPLARALHRGCDVGDEIPARLYAAVAQVLTYVYQLRVARQVGYGTPMAPRIDSLPPEA